MTFELPVLPYNIDALEPHISKNTMSFHYGKHHQAYVDNLNKLILDTDFVGLSLEEIIIQAYDKPEYAGIFNNAAQVYNHTFFWNSMTPNGGGKPTADLLAKIENDFGSFDSFVKEFKNAALTQFGSGWAWLVNNPTKNKLEVIKTSNAITPIALGLEPIITIDVWEHAYYLDYQNKRADFVDAYLSNLVNWK